MGDRVNGRRWNPIPLSMIQNSNPLTGVVSSMLVMNMTYLKGFIDDADSYGVESRFGHNHEGGKTGAPINRYLGYIAAETSPMWSYNVNTAGWQEITTSDYDLIFTAPKGINRAAVSICYTMPVTNWTDGDKFGISRGDETPVTLVTPAAEVDARVWSTEVNIDLRQGSINQFKLWIYKVGAGTFTGDIYGLSIREDTTIT